MAATSNDDTQASGSGTIPFLLNDGAPPMPSDTKSPEFERYWYDHVYKGDRMKQLSLRAVLMGGTIGMLMSVAGLYTTLKIGWAFGVAITACVISFVVWNAFRAVSGKLLTPMTILENNCMASTASAAGYSTGATIATAFGALLLLKDGNPQTADVQPWMVVAGFTFFTGALGVFLAIPMKRQMINQEQLPFPSGIACATTLQSLYSKGAESLQKAYSLVIALGCGALIGFLKLSEGGLRFVDAFFAKVPIRLPEVIPLPAAITGVKGGTPGGFFFEPSGLLIAAGMIVGLRVSLSMLLGSIILYFGAGPALLAIDQATANSGWVMQAASEGKPAGLVFDAAQQSKDVVLNIAVAGTTLRFTNWSLWGGTALMVFASLTSLALQWKTVLRSFGIGKDSKPGEVAIASGQRGGDAASDSMLEAKIKAIEVPNSWLVIGLIPITIGVVVVNWLAFQLHPLLGLLAVVMSFFLSMVACRATGETDTTPIGAMGKVMQLLFAVLPGAKGNSTINLMSASIASNAASSSADLLVDLKSGYLLGANPRQQFIAQFSGIFFGTLAIVPAWYLLVPDKAALEAFNPPATNMWKAVAVALTEGLNTLPKSALWAIVVGAIVGVILPCIERLLPANARKWMPSAMGLGLAWVIPFSNAFSFAIGAVIAWIWSRINKPSSERFTIPIASGLVAGESLLVALMAMLATAAKILGWNL